ncbi:YagK/YfjJ domain-containing protein, partial [Escherichia coli]|uniref:YagK/YfjJ domain-containing protein n=1 Tax=Escherichia coli TaxID=562 RepID=UPI000A6CB33A
HWSTSKTPSYTKSVSWQHHRAWYSALGLELDDYPGLVHYPENCRYILDVNDFNFEGEYNKLLNRLDYLAKLDTKAYGDGDRSFGCSRG